ncbi:hypothetical protein IscW_ISCW002666, partial [Ixodes scapularis]
PKPRLRPQPTGSGNKKPSIDVRSSSRRLTKHVAGLNTAPSPMNKFWKKKGTKPKQQPPKPSRQMAQPQSPYRNKVDI